MQNLSKTHEKNVQTAVHGEQVSNILDNVENVPFALRGAKGKAILYFLFSFIAAAELTAALTFYTASMGLSIIVAAVFCGAVAFGFHALLHGILSDTAKGIVFGKRTESGAMKAEVTGNIILSIVLLAIAACSVFFIGKKGFTAYRATAYEKKQDDVKGKLPPIKSIDASMLTSKSGKISSYKLEMLGDLEKAKAKTTEAAQAKDESDASRYDGTTATITDIVGASAFLIELLLALLAYSIATAKLAATMDEIARRNGASHRDHVQPSQQATTEAVQSTPSVTPQAASNTPNQQAATTGTTAQSTPSVSQPTNEKTGVTQRFNEYTVNDQNAITEKLKQDLERDMFYFSVDQIKAYLSRVNGLVTIVSDATTVTIKFHSPIVTDDITASVTDAVTAAPLPQKQIGFSDNRTPKNGNEGRTVIQGFARKNEAKTPITASVTANVTDAVIEKEDSKLKMCLYCENEYIYRIHNQKYCSEECRIAAWNEKTGKQLRKVAKQ
jgi:hypothetical protein